MSCGDFKNNCLKTHAHDPFVELDMFREQKPWWWLAAPELGCRQMERLLSTCHRLPQILTLVPFLSSFLMPENWIDS